MKTEHYNFECLEAIDVARFNEDMQKLLHGEEVVLPTFDFELGRRRYSGKTKETGRTGYPGDRGNPLPESETDSRSCQMQINLRFISVR